MALRSRFRRVDLRRRLLDPSDRRHEVVDGQLVVSPAPSLRHARTVLRIVTALQAWTREHGGEVVAGNYELLLGRGLALVPDALLVTAEHLDRFEEQGLRRPPDLVVEVCSERDSKARDFGAKRLAYDRFGVREYWVADLDADAVVAFWLAAGADRRPTRYDPGATLSSPLLPGFAVPVVELLAPRD